MSRVKLGDVARERREVAKEKFADSPTVGLEHLASGNVNLENWDVYKENTFTKIFRKGDVLFGRRRAYLKKAVYARFDGICSGDIIVIEALSDRIISELLPFVIQNDALFDFAVGKSAGSLSPRVKWENLKEYEFELPESKEEQRELADLLWSMVELENSYKKLIQSTDELVKSQFTEIMNKSELSYSEFGKIIEYLPKSTLNASKGKSCGKYPFFTSSIEQNKRTNDFLYDDECLIIGNGGVANVQYYNGKFSCGNHSFVMKSSSDEVFTKFMYCFFISNLGVLQEGFRGAGLQNISKEFINKIVIPYPDSDKQKLIIELFDKSDKAKSELEKCLKELQATYKKIISENLG